MTTESSLATTRPPVTLEFTEEQRQMIRDTYANGANDREFAVLIEIAKKRRLDPMLRQIHFVQRWNNELKRMVWAPQVSIDGLRAIAQRTGVYDGQDEPIFEERNGELYVCKVRVYRRDWPSNRPAVGVAYWSEYVQTTKDGSVTRMWRQMPHVMLSKVAESIALRKAFPEDCGGLYTDEEMGQAQNEDLSQSSKPAQRRQQVQQLPAQNEDPSQSSSEPITVPAAEPALSPELLAIVEAFHARVPEIELPGEAVAVWMKHRTDLAKLPPLRREDAWKALCKRTEEVGKMKQAKVWLKKAIAEEDARRAGENSAGSGAA